MRLSNAQAKRLGLTRPRRRPTKAEKAASDAQALAARLLFNARCKAHGLPEPVHEFHFHPTRQWRADYLFGDRVILEVEGLGGKYGAGRHQRTDGWLADMEKYNEAAILGYVLVRCTNKQIKTGAAFALVKRALERR